MSGLLPDLQGEDALGLGFKFASSLKKDADSSDQQFPGQAT